MFSQFPSKDAERALKFARSLASTKFKDKGNDTLAFLNGEPPNAIQAVPKADFAIHKLHKAPLMWPTDSALRPACPRISRPNDS